MKAKLSHKALKKMEKQAGKGEWVGLVELDKIPAFSAWLSCRHGYISQSPDSGEALCMYRDGVTIKVLFDGRRTRCTRGVMALWHVFACFCLGR